MYILTLSCWTVESSKCPASWLCSSSPADSFRGVHRCSSATQTFDVLLLIPKDFRIFVLAFFYYYYYYRPATPSRHVGFSHIISWHTERKLFEKIHSVISREGRLRFGTPTRRRYDAAAASVFHSQSWWKINDCHAFQIEKKKYLKHLRGGLSLCAWARGATGERKQQQQKIRRPLECLCVRCKADFEQ